MVRRKSKKEGNKKRNDEGRIKEMKEKWKKE